MSSDVRPHRDNIPATPRSLTENDTIRVASILLGASRGARDPDGDLMTIVARLRDVDDETIRLALVALVNDASSD